MIAFILKIAGILFLTIGIIGVFVPLLPTTPFLLLSATCFVKGSPELHRWLMQHPRWGGPLKDWQERKVIRTKAKLMAIGLMTFSASWIWWFGMNIPLWAKIAATGTMMLVGVFIFLQKSR